jgi:hypothetical protein
VRCDLRWKVACGLALDHRGLDASTLVYWRRRLAASDRPNRVFEVVADVIAETGVLAGRGRRVVDSTIFEDAVATQDTVTQLIAAIRRVGRLVPGAAGRIAACCGGHDYASPGKPEIDWEDPAAKDALVSALVNDANLLVAAFADAELAGEQAQAVALLALVAGQDVEPAEGSDGSDGRWRIAHKVSQDRVISVHDPATRHTRKSSQARRDGFRGHAVAEPSTGLVTDCALTQASGAQHSDPAMAARLLAGEQPAEVYGDSAYGTGELRTALAEAGHTAIIKPKPLKPTVEGGFTLDDFTVDAAAATVTCPNGITRPITPSRNVTFGAACRHCPLRGRCTSSKSGRTLILHPHDGLLRQARRQWATDPTLRRAYRQHRPNVERVIAQIATQGGRRVKLRYLGVAKNDWWLRMRCAALNLRRLLSLGLALQAGRWTIATG